MSEELTDYEKVIEELQVEWMVNNEEHAKGHSLSLGIRSSQIRALVGLLVKKGILKPDEISQSKGVK